MTTFAQRRAAISRARQMLADNTVNPERAIAESLLYSTELSAFRQTVADALAALRASYARNAMFEFRGAWQVATFELDATIAKLGLTKESK